MHSSSTTEAIAPPAPNIAAGCRRIRPLGSEAMSWSSRAYVLTAIILPLVVVTRACAQDRPPPLNALVHIGFDGSPDASAPEGLTPTEVQPLSYADGVVGQAADFRETGCVEYRGLPELNLQSGALELWINPAHPPQELEDHCYLQLLSDGASAGLKLEFYHVELSVQVSTWGSNGNSRRYGWGFAEDQWQHIVVTWDATGPAPTGLMLFKQGIETGYPRPYRVIEQPDLLRVGCLSPEEGQHAKALIDEITVYDRALTPTQITALYDAGAMPLPARLAMLREIIARDEAETAHRRDLLFNHRRIGVLHGRNTSLKNWPDETFERLRLPVPEPVHENDLTTLDLSVFDALFCPGGGGLNLTDESSQALRDYVTNGGGYVGVCGGAITAGRAGLIEAARYSFQVRGSVWTFLNEHPVTDGYDLRKKVLFPHASGPLFVLPEETDQHSIITFDVGNPPLPTFTHTIARELGEGRVVAFSGHPESAPETHRLLLNAIMWAARVIGVDEEAPR